MATSVNISVPRNRLVAARSGSAAGSHRPNYACKTMEFGGAQSNAQESWGPDRLYVLLEASTRSNPIS